MTPRIGRDGLRERLAAGDVTLVEALPAAHYVAEHLPGALNVPGDLTALSSCTALDRRADGQRSPPLPSNDSGYTAVRVYDGGKPDWFSAGLPMEGIRAAS